MQFGEKPNNTYLHVYAQMRFGGYLKGCECIDSLVLFNPHLTHTQGTLCFI